MDQGIYPLVDRSMDQGIYPLVDTSSVPYSGVYRAHAYHHQAYYSSIYVSAFIELKVDRQ